MVRNIPEAQLRQLAEGLPALIEPLDQAKYLCRFASRELRTTEKSSKFGKAPAELVVVPASSVCPAIEPNLAVIPASQNTAHNPSLIIEGPRKKKKRVFWLEDSTTPRYAHLVVVCDSETITFNEAVSSPQAEQWNLEFYQTSCRQTSNSRQLSP